MPDTGAVLSRLRRAGLPLGVLTNAGEAEATRHLEHLGIARYFDRVIGCDSGFGAKPDPAGASTAMELMLSVSVFRSICGSKSRPSTRVCPWTYRAPTPIEKNVPIIPPYEAVISENAALRHDVFPTA